MTNFDLYVIRKVILALSILADRDYMPPAIADLIMDEIEELAHEAAIVRTHLNSLPH